MTNVAVVRMNQGGKRFEVALYRNKIVNYRQKIETDLGEVLQTERVFTNVSKGLVASTKDLKKIFGTSDQETACRIILDKGQIQVSDLERKAALSNIAREVANMVATKCVNPENNRPYTANQIRDAMKVAEFAVQPKTARSVKQQFLSCVKIIQQKGVLNIQRAKMEVAIVAPIERNFTVITSRLLDEVNVVIQNNIEAEDVTMGDTNTTKDSIRIKFLIDPSHYRTVESIAKENDGIVEIIRHTVMREGDAEMSLEVERKHQIEKSRNERGFPSSEHGIESFDNKSPVSSLVEDFQTMTTSSQAHNTSTDSEERYIDDDNQYAVVNTRKANKKAQKKSKKAKRREKEDTLIRQQRIEAEKDRKEERTQRLGKKASAASTVSSVPNNESIGNSNQYSTEMKRCITCGAEIPANEYRSHFQSDWHRYNVKLKMKGVAPVTYEEFTLCDSETFFATEIC